MRIVVDTNVLLSGLIWRGAPHELIVHARTGAISLISSPALIAELAGVLARDKFRTILSRSGTDPQDLLGRVRLLLEIVEPPRLSTPVSRDPDDDEVLAVAAASQPDLIVSGDEDLLVLGGYAGVPIVSPARAVEIIRAGG